MQQTENISKKKSHGPEKRIFFICLLQSWRLVEIICE